LLSQGGGSSSTGSFELIETVVATGSSNSITFNSIPSTYKHLQLRFVLLSGTNYGQASMRLNADSGANYSYHYMTGYNDAVSSNRGLSTSNMLVTGPNVNVTSRPNIAIVDILDYSNTSKFKTTRSLNGTHFSGGGVFSEITQYSGSWRSTAAVTSMTLNGDFNWTSASRFSLYGIKGS
jgi:hypothetical protein